MSRFRELRRLRKSHNYSCTDMGRMLGMSRIYYWQLENRKRKLSYAMAVRVAGVFSLKPDKVFYEDFC